MEHQRDAEQGWGDRGRQCGCGFGQVGRPRNLLMKSAEGAGVDCGQTPPRASYMAAWLIHGRASSGLGADGPVLGSTGGELPV